MIGQKYNETCSLPLRGLRAMAGVWLPWFYDYCSNSEMTSVPDEAIKKNFGQ